MATPSLALQEAQELCVRLKLERESCEALVASLSRVDVFLASSGVREIAGDVQELKKELNEIVDELLAFLKRYSGRGFALRFVKQHELKKELKSLREAGARLSGKLEAMLRLGSPKTRMEHAKDDAKLAAALNDAALDQVRVNGKDVAIGARLGSEAGAELFKGTFRGEYVVVKTLKDADETELCDFVKEVKLVARLSHPNIVGFVGAMWTSHGEISMLTEFVPGGDLWNLLRRFEAEDRPHGFDLQKTKIALQLAEALAYSHGLSPPVAHQDVRSMNVLLTEKLDAKLAHYGAYREPPPYTQAAMPIGRHSKRYIAPEIIKDEARDERADIFSFGMLLTEIDLHAEPYAHVRDPDDPSRPVSEMILLVMIEKQHLQPDFSAGTLTDVVELGRSCTAYDPDDRPTALYVASILHRILQEQSKVTRA